MYSGPETDAPEMSELSVRFLYLRREPYQKLICGEILGVLYLPSNDGNARYFLTFPFVFYIYGCPFNLNTKAGQLFSCSEIFFSDRTNNQLVETDRGG